MDNLNSLLNFLRVSQGPKVLRKRIDYPGGDQAAIQCIPDSSCTLKLKCDNRVRK